VSIYRQREEDEAERERSDDRISRYDAACRAKAIAEKLRRIRKRKPADDDESAGKSRRRRPTMLGDKALHGNWCRLYEASCSKFEVFPERYDR